MIIIMEYFQGKKLSTCKFLKINNFITLKYIKILILAEEIIKIIKNLVYTVKFLHDNNIIHRDIAPKNIIYNSLTNQAKLIGI